MKKLILVPCLLLLISSICYAQTNNAITVFTEGGERFYLILNGIKQNATPETNVRATGLNAQQYKAKVIFDQKGIADCDRSIPMMWAAEPVSNTEFTFSIKKDKKGKYKWQFVSQAPISAGANTLNPTTTNAVNTTVNTINTASQQSTSAASMPTNSVNVNTGVNTANSSTTVTTTTTSTATGTNGQGANVNIGINGLALSMNMNVNDGMNTGVTTSTTTTTTSYTTSSTTSAVANTNTGNTTQTNAGNVSLNMNTNGTSTTTGTNVSSPAANNAVCSVPMNANDYAEAKKSISAKPFEDSKKTIAMQVADNNCLSVDQIKGIMALFSFEDTKLEYAKYCFDHCTEKKNYYKVNDAFTFDSSSESLNQYIKAK